MVNISNVFSNHCVDSLNKNASMIYYDQFNNFHNSGLVFDLIIERSNDMLLELITYSRMDVLQLQGWYNKIYRDEVVAEWRKVKGNMSLHVHCHISGGHFLLDSFARLRFFIFTKELPLVIS